MSGRSEPLTGYRHICPVCGKEFWGSSEWKYKKSKRAHDAVYMVGVKSGDLDEID